MNTAKWVVGELGARGEVRRVFLGIAGQTLTLHRRVQRYFELKSLTAVQVVAVEENGPARRAGLQVGDLIVELNGQAITTVDDIHRLLSRLLAGSTLKLVILRGTERREVEIVFEWLGKVEKR